MIIRLAVAVLLIVSGVVSFGQENKGSGSVAQVPSDVTSVLRVIDGDTVQVKKSDGEKITYRLIGVNTPETVDPRKTVECFGKEASDYLKKTLAGVEAAGYSVAYDDTQQRTDKYDRHLVYLYVGDRTGSTTKSINQQIIENGYGYEYTYRVPYKYQKEFKESERLARDEKRGLWADGVCYTN